ncbi:MAG: hypothetical protein ABR925_05885 [Acidimicrobiales bacterium]
MAEALRVLDFGRAAPLRSQTLWHAISYGISSGAPTTLSFVRPAAPYVCLGYHRDLEEVDRDYCAENGLPILRRMVGGGPVYLDEHQLFFQMTLPAGDVPAARHEALRMLLEPVVVAFGAVGIPAELDEEMEICLGEAKICGHGAGQIEDAVVLCGNLIELFDHARATRVLAIADLDQRDQTAALMRRFVVPTPVDEADFKAALTRSVAAAFGLEPERGELTGREHEALADLDARFESAPWLAGPRGRGESNAFRLRPRQVKIRAGVWTVAAEHEGVHVAAAIVNGKIDQVTVHAAELNGSAREIEAALVGTPLTLTAPVLAGFGDVGRRLAVALASADAGRI